MDAETSLSPLACDVRQAAKILGISRTNLYQQIAAGRLPVRKAGKRTLVETSALRAWLAALPLAVTPTAQNNKGGRA